MSSRARGRRNNRMANKAIHPQMRAIARREGNAGNGLAPPGGGMNLLDVINGLTSGRSTAGFMAAMPRNPRDDSPFGPLNPLAPNALDVPRDDTGRPGPRLTEYPVAWNVPTGDHRLIPWATLREAARSVDIFRACIETRKKDVRGLKWAFTVSEEAINEAYQADPSRGKSDVARELREKWTPEIKRLSEFWDNPWKSQGLSFAKWTNGVLEDYIVLDAVAVYPQTNYGGDLLALELIDGTTIKPLLDWRGARPEPPFPAYQQILYGFPRGEWTATTLATTEEGSPVIESGYLADQLFYQVENYRSFTPYGFSAVEQALISARLYLRRQGWMLAEYNDGVMPTSLLEVPETTPITPNERIEWEASFNDEMTGQTAARHRSKVLFPGMTPHLIPSVDERYKPEYDLHLIKLACMHFGVAPSKIGFTDHKGLGSSGFHESQMGASKDAGETPDAQMIAQLVNSLSTDYLRKPAEITFGPVDPDSDDQKVIADILLGEINSAQKTINEARTKNGMPALAIPEADMPFIASGTGPVFLEGSSAPKPLPGQLGPDGKPLPGAATNAGAAPITNAGAAANADQAQAAPAAPNAGPLDDFLDAKGVVADLAKWTYDPNQSRAADGRFGSGPGHGTPKATPAPKAPSEPAMPNHNGGVNGGTIDKNKALQDKIAAMSDDQIQAAMAHYGAQVGQPGQRSYTGQAAILHALAAAHSARQSKNNGPHNRGPVASKTRAKKAKDPNAPLSSAKLNAMLEKDHPHSGLHVTNSHGQLHITLADGMTGGAKAALKDLEKYADEHGLTITASEHGDAKHKAALEKAYKAAGFHKVKTGNSVSWQRTPKHHHTTKKAAGTALDDAVCDQLSADYPPEAIAWVHDAKWTGPTAVPLDEVDFEDSEGWDASTGGKDADKVDRYTDYIKRGRMKPVILVAKPGSDLKMVADGHHRALAYQKLGRPVTAYVGTVDSGSGPWDTMHAKQHATSDGVDDIRPTSAPPATDGAVDMAKAAELRAYRTFTKRAHSRPFRWEHHTPAEIEALSNRSTVAGMSIDLAKVGPKGYEHGWIFVGVPGVGAHVFHPHHGHGTITSHEGGKIGVDFGGGKSHTFEASHREGASGHFQERETHAAEAAKPVEIPQRKGDEKAKRGDLYVEERTEHTYYQDRGTVESKSYKVHEITSVTREGKPKMIRELAWGGTPVSVDYMPHGRGRTSVIPGDQVDVQGLQDALKARTYPNSTTPMAHEDLKSLAETIRPHLVGSGATARPRRLSDQEQREGATKRISAAKGGDAQLAALRKELASNDLAPSVREFLQGILDKNTEHSATTIKAGEPDPKADPPTPAPDHRWPAWAVDAALTAAVALALRQAMMSSVNPGELARRFYEWAAGQSGITPRGVLSWLRAQGAKLNIAQVLRDAAAQGWAVGSRAARSILDAGGESVRMYEPGFTIGVDWSGWTPGNVAAARLIMSEDGSIAGFERLLASAESEIEQIAAHRLDEIAAVLADGLERGEGPQAIGRALRGVLDDPNWSEMVAWTETNRAQSAAALDMYAARDVPGIEWFTAMDQRVCKVCGANEARGPIPLGQNFPSGDPHPPAHPRCRCAVLPVDGEHTYEDASKSARAAATGHEGDAEQLHHYWTEGEGKAKWVGSPHPWTALYHHLLRHMDGDVDKAKRTASQWFHDTLGFWPGTKHIGAVPIKG